MYNMVGRTWTSFPCPGLFCLYLVHKILRESRVPLGLGGRGV